MGNKPDTPTILQRALEIARAQAGVRPMTAAEVAAYINEVAKSLDDVMAPEKAKPVPIMNPRSSIGETYVTCLECGKRFRMMSARHLKKHGLTAKEYKAKWGLKKDVALAAKSLVRMRRRQMDEMRLWERTGSKGE